MSEGKMNETEIINTFKGMQQECSSLFNKIAELQVDRDEHTLVINQLRPLDPSRKAFRLIGGVLVERTVAEVLPSVEQHLQGIEQLVGNLEQQLQAKEEETKAFKERYQIRSQSELQAQRRSQASSAGASTASGSAATDSSNSEKATSGVLA